MVDTGGSQTKTAARSRKQPPRHTPGQTLGAFLVAALFCAGTLYYLTWRLTVTNWTLWWLGVPLLLAELFSIFSTLGLLYTTWPRPYPPIHASLDPSTLPVFVLIPPCQARME